MADRETLVERLLDGGDTCFVPPKPEDGGDGLMKWLRNNWALRVEAASELSRLKAKVEELAAALERDRSNVITACNEFSDAFARRSWLLASRGPYEWDDDRYRDEFQGAYDELAEPILKLQKIGKDWSLCPTDPEAIRQARINWKERAEATEAKVADLSARLARAVDVMRDNVAAWETCTGGYSYTPVQIERLRAARAFLSEQENRHGNG